MDLLNNLILGFEVAVSWQNLLWCLLGTILGTLVGVLPGLGPTAAIALLLPFTYTINDPVASLIMLAGIFYGSQYGGSTAAILINFPGEAASTITALDGHQMAKKGRAGAALTVSAIGSFFAGIVSTFLIAGAAYPIVKLALMFGSGEYATLMLLGVIGCVVLSSSGFVSGIALVLVGMLLGTIGTDVNSGVNRFDFGIPEFTDGFPLLVLLLGLFGLGEVIYNALHSDKNSLPAVIPRLKDLWPTKQEWRDSFPAIARGTGIGSLLGALPGGGAVMGSLASYIFEKKISKDPKKFGHGAIQGVAGPESANNAAAQTSFVPMLTLGLPTHPVMALLAAAMFMHGITPGPRVISSNPDLFWGLIASFAVGNFILVLLNLPLIGFWVRLISIPKKWLYLVVIFCCVVGAWSINNNWFHVWLLVPVALVGYFLKSCRCDPSPLIMGYIIGKLLEEYIRRALVISQGDWNVFVASPISQTFSIIIILLISIGIFTTVRSMRSRIKT